MPWQPHDLDRLAAAIDTLRDLGVWSAIMFGCTSPRVHVSRETLAQVAQMTGIRPEVKPRPEWGTYEAVITFGSHLRLCAIFAADQLPEIGYRVPSMPKPIPIEEATPEEATADAGDRADQADGASA